MNLKIFSGIRITLKGVAQTSWRVSKKESDNTQRRIGKNSLQSESFGQEVYFSRRFYIAGVYAGKPYFNFQFTYDL